MNRTEDLKQLSNDELQKLYKEVEDTIYGVNACYGTKDVIYFHEICREMDKREE